jgi:hypothetical protein
VASIRTAFARPTVQRDAAASAFTDRAPNQMGHQLASQADASQAKGRFNRTSAKRSEIRCTQGAFHR